MKKLYFLAIASFAIQENLNQKNKLNQLCFFNEKEELINKFLLEINFVIKKEIRAMIEDKNIINNMVEKQNLIIINRSYRLIKTLISIFICFVFFYFIYLGFKKYQLKTQGNKQKEDDEEKNTEYLDQLEMKREEWLQDDNIKYLLDISKKKVFFYKKDGRLLKREFCFFEVFFLHQEWRHVLNKLFGKPPIPKTEEYTRESILKYWEGLREIDYNFIVNFAIEKQFCFFDDSKVYYFARKNDQERDYFYFNIVNLDAYFFEQNKEDIQNLNRFCIDKHFFKELIIFFKRKILSEMNTTLETIKSLDLKDINEFIIKTISVLPTRDEVGLVEIKYGFFDSSVHNLNGYFLYKEKYEKFNDFFSRFFYKIFSHITKNHGKTFFIKRDQELMQNKEFFEVPNQDIEIAKERLKNLCFLSDSPEDKNFSGQRNIYTFLPELIIRQKTGQDMIKEQESKIRTYLAKQYNENKEYYLVWDNIITLLKNCLLTQKEIDLGKLINVAN